MNAVMDALTAHTTMSKQAIGSEKVREGLKDVLLVPAVDAKNTIATRKAGEVLRVIRNAPAHGNIVYSTVFVFALRCT